MFFLEKFKNIVDFENVIKENVKDIQTLKDAKKWAFPINISVCFGV